MKDYLEAKMEGTRDEYSFSIYSTGMKDLLKNIAKATPVDIPLSVLVKVANAGISSASAAMEPLMEPLIENVVANSWIASMRGGQRALETKEFIPEFPGLSSFNSTSGKWEGNDAQSGVSSGVKWLFGREYLHIFAMQRVGILSHLVVIVFTDRSLSLIITTRSAHSWCRKD